MTNCAETLVFLKDYLIKSVLAVHCKKHGVTEHPKGAIFYCFHGNPYCYHGNSKILLPWGVQLLRVFYSVCEFHTHAPLVGRYAPGFTITHPV